MRLFYLFFFLSLGCSTKVWVITQNNKGGTIGYSKRSSDFRKKVSSKIHCRPYDVISELKKSQKINKVVNDYITSSPNTAGSHNSIHESSFSQGGTTSQRQTTPISITEEEIWYELTYKCK